MGKIIGLLFAVGWIWTAMNAYAGLAIMDVDGTSYALSGTLTSVEGSAGQLLTSDRWASITVDGTDLVGVLPDPQTNADVYWRTTGLYIPVSSARYVEVHYSVNGDAFSGGNHRIYLSSTEQALKGIGLVNSGLIEGSPGTHSFILDLQSDATVFTGSWRDFRWDMWNDLGQDGKSITIDKVVFGEALQTVSASVHPRLLFSDADIPALQQKVQSGWLQEAFGRMVHDADIIKTLSTTPYFLGGATAGRNMNYHVSTLALTGIILEDTSYIDVAVDILMSACEQTDVQFWVDKNHHLSVGDALHAYGMGYDWLYNYMTPSERAILEADIRDLMDWQYDLSVSVGVGYADLGSPRNMSCNHNAVMHGGLGIAALAMYTPNSPESQRVSRFITEYFKWARDDTGYNLEGLFYYGYGAWCAIPFSIAYERAGFGNLIDTAPKNYQIPEWQLRFMQPWGGEQVPLNDAGSVLSTGNGTMALVSRARDRVGLWTFLKYHGADGTQMYTSPLSVSSPGRGASLPYAILFADETLQPQSPADAGLELGKFFHLGRGAFRSSWEDNATMATFTCGYDRHRGHNHRDEGSFTFSAFGDYFAIDPGAQFSSTRGHNCLLVDGLNQQPEEGVYDTWGDIVATQDLGDAWYMKGDASRAYLDVLGLDTATRQFLFVKGVPNPYLILADDFEGGGTHDFSWLLHTRITNEVVMGASPDEFYMVGGNSGSICYVKFLGAPPGMTIQESDFSGVTIEGVTPTFKEVVAEYTGINPRFRAILVAVESIEDLPDIQAEQVGDQTTVRVSSSAAGLTDKIIITDDDMQFERVKNYYLQAAIPVNDSILDKAYWFDAPSGGRAMASTNTFAGNRFVVNGKDWRSPNVSGTAVFDGTIVVGTAGSGLLEHYCADLHLAGGLEIDHALTVSPHRSNISTSVSNLCLGASGNLIFRTLIGGNNTQHLAVDGLSGTGQITFGTAAYTNDVNGMWSIRISDAASTFNGIISLVRGGLSFDNAFVLEDAAFTIDASRDNSVALDHDIGFDRISFGAITLTNGSYSATELNSAFGTDCFSGSGTMRIGLSSCFATWVADKGLARDEEGYFADGEQDGMNNFVEYALGGHPKVDDADTILPEGAMVNDGGTNWMQYIYRRRLDAETRGLEYNVMVSTNLAAGGWMTVGLTVESGSGPTGGEAEFESVTNQIPVDGSTKFIKLHVTED